MKINIATGREFTVDWSEGAINWHRRRKLKGMIFLAVGDILLEGEKEKVIDDRGSSFLFGPWRSVFQSADIVLGNLENPLSERGNPIYKMGPHF